MALVERAEATRRIGRERGVLRRGGSTHLGCGPSKLGGAPRSHSTPPIVSRVKAAHEEDVIASTSWAHSLVRSTPVVTLMVASVFVVSMTFQLAATREVALAAQPWRCGDPSAHVRELVAMKQPAPTPPAVAEMMAPMAMRVSVIGSTIVGGGEEWVSRREQAGVEVRRAGGSRAPQGVSAAGGTRRAARKSNGESEQSTARPSGQLQ